MRTRAVATVTASLLAVFLMGLGPPAGAGLSPITNLQFPPNVDEGDTAHLTGAINQECATGEHLSVNWGDGSAAEEFTDLSSGPFDESHTYADDNPPGVSDDIQVSVVLTDNCGHTPAQASARSVLHNVDPSIDTFNAFPRIAGEASRVGVEFSDPGTLDTFTVTIDWGDGSQNTVLLLPHIQKIREGHRYMAPGQYKVDVTVQDDDGGADEDSILFDVPLGLPRLVIGPDRGRPGLVKTYDAQGSSVGPNFLAYRSSYTGGVRVAAGDVNGDGVPDIITGAGKGGSPHVKAFDGVTGNLLQSFFAYNPSFQGGVFVAAGDVNGDGVADIITGADAGGGPLVKGFSVVDPAVGVVLVKSFFAYNSSFTGGVRVAAGDLNGDGVAEIITGAGAGAGPHVKVFDGKGGGTLMSFFAYNPSFTGGVFVAFGATMEEHGT